MMAKWISSHRDLPLLLNQWANVVRWELRPRMFLRTTEFLWQEGHTAHADEADAMRETLLALDLYEQVSRDVAAMPVIAGEKTAGERFPGARRTYTVEAMMRDGRALQSGTSHYMGTNFAKAFNIQYAAESGELELCHATSWGMGARMIGGVIMTHGDDKGLILPPLLAPYQVVIVPIGRGEQAGQVLAPARELAARLHERRHPRAPGRPAAPLPRVQVQRLGDAQRPDPAGARAAGPGGGHGADGHPARQREDAGLAGLRPGPAHRRADRLPGPAAAAGDRVPR